MKTWIVCKVALVCSLLSLAGCTNETLSDVGGPGQPCYPNDTCNAGLLCQEGTCVEGQGDGGGGGDATLPWVDGGQDGAIVDAPPGACKPGVDSDHDTIDDLAEGCALARDSDSDGTPDYLDADSDDDGIDDSVEAGDADPSTPPTDSDGDGYADYVDSDSDNDSVDDSVEDRNGDGRLGCCRSSCGEPIDGCPPVAADGCGPGQTCQGGSCSPAVAFECSDGESDPAAKDTFGLGSDTQIGNTICTDETASAIAISSDKEGDWSLALAAQLTVSKIKINGAAAQEAAAAIDHKVSGAEVAGFVVSRPAGGTDIAGLADEVGSALQTIGGVVFVNAGSQRTTHDGHQAVIGLVGEASVLPANDVSTVRNQVIGLLLGRPLAELYSLPSSYGAVDTKHRVRLSAVLRGDGRALFIGSVVLTSNDSDATKASRAIAEDLGNGTALAEGGATTTQACDALVLDKLPQADVIWVMDESGSMEDNRAAIAQGATELFAAALATGLDFRMAVTSVLDPQGQFGTLAGKFCSKISTDNTDDGGADRFLLPSESTIFASCVKNPPGLENAQEYGLINAYEAVARHLPREPNAPDKIRTDAQLVIIVVTDEVPNSLNDILGYENYDQCTLDASTQTAVDQAVQKYKDFFGGATDPEATAQVHLIAGTCNNACNADVAHGYKEVAAHTGGEILDVCQTSYTVDVQQLLDKIASAAKTLVLDQEPISASLAVVVDGQPVERSNAQGFRYSRQQNSIALTAVPVTKGSKLVVSYRTWQ